MRIEVIATEPRLDGRAIHLLRRLRAAVSDSIEDVVLVDVYLLDTRPELSRSAAESLFADPVAQAIFIDSAACGQFLPPATDPARLREPRAARDSAPAPDRDSFLLIEIGSRPGVTDPVAITARKAVEAELRLPLDAESVIQTARQYLVRSAGPLPERDRMRLAALLHNPLVQQAVVLSAQDWHAGKRFPALYPHRVAPSPAEVATFDLAGSSDRALGELSKRRLLALTLAEMQAIRGHYADPAVTDARKAAGLTPEATDVELEMIAQTWSEHCKHKIFNATIHYREGAKSETIRSLFSTYIRSTTEELAGQKPFLRSVFHDNSGVIAFDEDHLVCFKVETHNSPSALDPYGGAITGIVGVNRDILGTGKCARPIFNTDVLCFGYPDSPDSELPEGLIHPALVLEGVHRGIVDGGNQSGIPVVAGAFLFDESFAGKPLVFCGTGGILPAMVRGEAGWIKHIDAGDLAVMVGGRIGKDGIHGATFSSLALDESSPTSAVQIGDPITQRRMTDFLLEARDLGLFKGITDNGAGGLSSSLGEMAQSSGGVRIELDRCPLKYPGLAPWEILVSESQERMSLAVGPGTLEELLALARRRDVEATVVGEFTASGRVEMSHQGKLVGMVPLAFLHDGLPVMELEAVWPEPPSRAERPLAGAAPVQSGAPGADPASRAALGSAPSREPSLSAILLALLADPSIGSKEPLIRQYDHEVQGQSVVKPFVGARADGPSDGAVLRPLPESNRGLTVTHGLCPGYSLGDTYHMAMCAVDEAFRAHIALGGDPDAAAALDNFCWPDPVASDQTPDGAYKLAQLVRACRGLREACLAYGIPLISGKDSMKNDSYLGGRKLSIKPTLLVSLMGIIADVRAAITADFKRSGESLYLVGASRGELGGSAYERVLSRSGGASPAPLGPPPRPYPEEALPLYRSLHAAMDGGLVTACHDLADGGLAAALAECALAGRLGAAVELSAVSLAPRPAGDGRDPLGLERLLFGESPSRFLVTVGEGLEAPFERLLSPLPVFRIGRVTADERLTMRRGGVELVDLPLATVESAWKSAFPEG